MSQKAASDFIGQLVVDTALRDELSVALASAKDRPEALGRTVAFAAARGYEVTSEELARFVEAGGEPRELTDEELAKVAGGGDLDLHASSGHVFTLWNRMYGSQDATKCLF